MKKKTIEISTATYTTSPNKEHGQMSLIEKNANMIILRSITFLKYNIVLKRFGNGRIA